MMELNMWNEDLLLGSEWDLDLLTDHPNGQFGDLKLGSRTDGDDMFNFQPQDAVIVKHFGDPSKDIENFLGDPSEDGDILGTEWMESSDLGSYLDALGSSIDALPLESSLDDYTSSLETGNALIKEEPISQKYNSSISKIFAVSNKTPISDFKENFQAILSPPDSPEQVAPFILLSSHNPSPGEAIESFQNVSLDSFSSSLDENDSSLNNTIHVSSIAGIECCEVVNSSLLISDVESLVSSSAPSSPFTTCSIIESSPELYKVISASSIEPGKRFSPYSKAKLSRKDSNGSRKVRPQAQPVPEHVIEEQLNKKDRKKLQNKNAAIRYRQKKKNEAVGIKSEEQVLEEENSKLKVKVEDLQREIKYMKNLMEDVCRAKGLL
ncbi:unnamed protein product [Lymnaea stagnalis]|uniref:BZIP domain-containing protein n=1 Tax=Lymnaea stagnalis TaxID=6523 RepID=A0AAV2I6S1_LYMST